MRVLKYLLLLPLAWFFLHCLWVVSDGFTPFNGKADIAVVLGNTVLNDGSLSPWLQGRVDEALRLYKNKQVKKIFVSGGIGKNGYPEGDCMRNYLLQHGVDKNAIITDNHGDNTWFTAKHFAGLDSTRQFQTVVAVTSYYHITRTKWITRKLAHEETTGAYSKALFWADWYGLTREFFAYYKYRIVY